MLIKNCKIILNDGQIRITDILIKNEKIVEIEENITIVDEEIIDAKNNFVFPGLIDVHTHMRDPGLCHKEDFTTGSMACAKGGITTFIDMPNTIPNTTTVEILNKKRENSVGRSYTDYGFHFGGSRNDNSLEIEKIKDEVASTKIFLNMSTGDMLVEEDRTLENLFNSSKIISVHAEEGMVERAIKLSEKYDKTLYLCHLSKEEEVEMLREAKKKGLKVFGEVAPHHLFLNSSDVNELLRMKPELKEKSDCEALWEGLRDGTIDCIGTDHAPHTIEEKRQKLTFGIPGVENSLELMLSAVDSDRITLKRMIEVMSGNPAKIFGLKDKGNIEVGYDGDLIIVNTEDKGIINDKNIISKCGWTPYVGKMTGGKVLTTILRGSIIYNEGSFKNKIGKEVGYNMDREKKVARALLSTEAVRLNVETPFTFVSGIKSPIYCDNRKMIGFPEERKVIVKEFIKKLEQKDFDIIAGTATAGIPWAAFIATEMNKPMSYIRGEKKAHGAGRQIEGADFAGKKVVVIEDLISTGGSSIKAVDAAREAGATEVEVFAIFSYEFDKAYNNFKSAGIPWESLSNFSTLIQVAEDEKYLTKEDAETASKWNKTPDTWGR